MKTCAFCRQEPPTEKFYVKSMKKVGYDVCEKCQKKLIGAWEDKERAIARYEEFTEVLLGLLKPEDLTENQ